MTDKVSKENRSRIMASIKRVSKLEDKISRAMWHKGGRFRRNTKGMYGTPDFSIKKYRVVIFIDSCFWHHCPIHGNIPKSNVDFWKNKLIRNVDRDRKVTEYYEDKGWNILRVWEHEFKDDFEEAIDKIVRFIENAKE